MKDYYQILGVKKDANADEIKRAYHKLAHQHHPDKGGDEQKFKEISEAYQVLSDRGKRAQYDQFGQAFPGGGPRGPDFNWSWGRPGAAPDGEGFEFDFGDLGDVFEEFFGFGGPSRRKEAKKGRDIEIGLEIALEETLRAQEKEISLEKFVRCQRCRGSGGEPGSGIKECFSCRGTGEVQQIKRSFLGAFTSFVTCPECRGEGQKPEKPCNVCKGEGRIKGIDNFKVFIPAGVDQNQIIKVEGAGDPGKRGNRPGDLYLRIFLKPHRVFKRKGDDLFMNLPLAFSQLALGGQIEIADLAGNKFILNIPSGSEPGKMLRLTGKGIPHFQGRGQGNLYIELVLKVPKKLNQKQKELLEQLKEEGI
ncbi:MAG: molecular chaperone DnaJ [bacterium]|nr:molecular chaperone DnaJ [bacterium]